MYICTCIHIYIMNFTWPILFAKYMTYSTKITPIYVEPQSIYES